MRKLTQNQMSRRRVAVVGAGLMGTWHAYYAALNDGEVLGIVDPDAQHAEKFARKHKHARHYATLKDLLAANRIDVVHICTPDSTHKALALEALNSRCDVLLEKPLATTLADANELISVAQQNAVLIAPVHQMPFCRGFEQLITDLPRLGRIKNIQCVLHSAGADKFPDRTREILTQMLAHPLSLFFRLTGMRVTTDDITLSYSSEDRLELSGSFENTRLHVALDMMARPTRNELIVYGTKATAFVDLFHGYCFIEDGSVSRAKKIAQPFENAALRFLSAGNNLLCRASHLEPAYPGLRRLTELFYAATADRVSAPISNEEIRFVAKSLEKFSTVSVSI